jgi:hypothetical protein
MKNCEFCGKPAPSVATIYKGGWGGKKEVAEVDVCEHCGELLARCLALIGGNRY